MNLDGLEEQIRGGDNGESGEEFGEESEDLGNGPSGSDAVGDFAHGGD